MRRYLGIVLATAALAVSLLVPAAAMAELPGQVTLPGVARGHMPEVAKDQLGIDECPPGEECPPGSGK